MKNIISLLTLGVSSVLLMSCGADDTASRITFSAGTVIYDQTEQLYQLPFALIVTDTNGNAVGNQKVTLSVVPLQYYKGSYALGTEQWTTNVSAICPREDTNQNGILEAGEDVNGSGRLEPTNPATIGQHPVETPTLYNSKELITDQWGSGHFSLIYPKAEANWITVRITASTQVTGTESSEVLTFYLIASQEDLESIDTTPPSGSIASKYGIVGDCFNPN